MTPSDEFIRMYRQALTAYNDGVLAGDLSEAERLFQRARAEGPELAGPYRYLALIAKSQARYRACVDFATQAICANPTGAQARATQELREDCATAHR